MTINVTDFGAGPCSTPEQNTIGIRAAFAQAEASGHGVVYFPAGEYQVDGEFVVPQNVHIRGDGIEVTKVTAEGANRNNFPSLAVLELLRNKGTKWLKSLCIKGFEFRNRKSLKSLYWQ